MDFFTKYFDEIHHHTKDIDHNLLIECNTLINKLKTNRGKIILVGNGGSAAMASHVAVDFTKAAKVRAINFNEADLITCFGNDYGYENWVTEAIRAYSDDNDLIILISSSGQSENIVNAAKFSKEKNLDLITLSGFKSSNPLREIGDVNLWINSDNYNYVEMSHHIWLVALCDFVIASNQ
jgi:D-sedoheptulose 7-phosphate isomerase